MFKRFVKDESGATASEYGLIAALIAVGLIASLELASDGLNGVFGEITEAMTPAPDPAPDPTSNPDA